MNNLEKTAIAAGEIITTIYIVLAFTIGGGIIGVIFYEIIEKVEDKIIALFGFVLLGFVVGIIASIDSLRMGFFNFITKLNATNELDDKRLVDEFYKNKK